MTAQDYVRTLGLQPHPEGGYFAETYRSPEVVGQAALPDRFSGDRAFSTAIYFLLKQHQFSTLHRIQADEVWHFYAGHPLDVFVIDPDARLTVIHLGNRPDRSEVFQAVVPAGCWFGSKLAPLIELGENRAEPPFALVGCTVAPGFDFADFELGDRQQLLTDFPQHRDVIEQLTS